MVSELSILIPVYNLEVTQLVQDLHSQCRQCAIPFEIRVYDDGSEEEIKELNRPLNGLDQVYYLELQRNLGRSAIRNLLAREARYGFLLFLDNDNLIPNANFIQNYLSLPEAFPIVLGGTEYDESKPTSAYVLRWRYGLEREQQPLSARRRHPYRYFALNNTLCRRELFLQIKLDEKMQGYGYEDLAFSMELQKAGIPVHHIHNPVVHVGLDRVEVYLAKTREAVRNLSGLAGRVPLGDDIRLLQAHRMLRKSGLVKPFLFSFGLVEKSILRNLHSPNPNLIYFDLYRLKLLAEEVVEKKRPRKVVS
jgi:glycosyltransferase involved in cell wall biosynthesis